MRFSICIANYNYAAYLRQAIDSALSLDWSDKEVIVVDDGSTDNSRAIMLSYGRRIRAIFKANGGQTSAVNQAFKYATGDIVIFLDADDVLLPMTASVVARHWNDKVSKVQWLMAYINAVGKLTGGIYPNHTPHSPDQIRKILLTVGAHSTAFTSANAYSKKFLDRVMPLPEDEIRGTDTYLNSVAPLGGDVIDLDVVMTHYRIHGGNDWASAVFDPHKYMEQYHKELVRLEYLQRMAPLFGEHINLTEIIQRNAHLLAHRLACRVINPYDQITPNESRLTLLRRILRSPRLGKNRLSHAIILAWATSVAILPRRLALTAIKYRMVPAARPAFVVKAMKKLSVLR